MPAHSTLSSSLGAAATAGSAALAIVGGNQPARRLTDPSLQRYPDKVSH